MKKVKQAIFDLRETVVPATYNLITNNRNYFSQQFSPIFFYPMNTYDNEQFDFINIYCAPNIIPYRYLISTYGRVYDTFRNIFINPIVNKGYCNIRISSFLKNIDGSLVQFNLLIHRAVLMTFNYIPYCESLEVNHKDGNGYNNHISNLEWTTHVENMEHAMINRLMKSGEEAFNATITNIQAEEVCRRLESGESNKSISDNMGLDYEVIRRIKNRTSYRHISENFDIPELEHHGEKFTKDEVISIYNRLLSGEPARVIAKDLNVTESRIRGIKHKEYYKDITDGFDNIEKKKYSDKMTEDQVREICQMLQDGKTPNDIAKILNKPYTTIDSIHKRCSHTHISKDYVFPERYINKRLTEDQVREICQMLQDNVPHKEIADKFGTSKHVINKIYKRKHFINISKDYNF